MNTNKHLGTVGSKLVLNNLTVIKLITSANSNGTYTYTYKFKDLLGNIIVWFSAKDVFNVDTVVNMQGFVKAHDVCHRSRSNTTIMHRCKPLA